MLVTGTNLPVADVIAEAERICAAARALKVPVKLVGGAAVNLHSKSAREAPLKRKYGDLDFVAPSKQRQAAEKLFESLGYEGDRPFTPHQSQHPPRQFDPLCKPHATPLL